MQCDIAREALSAELDGELEEPEGAALAAHLAGCVECRAHRSELAGLHRFARVRPADEVPDLVAPIMAAVELPAARRAPNPEWVRYALFAVALTQLVLALPALVLGEDAGASIHVAREMGSFDVALAAGLLFAAWQPHRASGLLPLACALAVSIVLTAVADTVGGRALAGSEAHHVLDLAGVLFLWLVTRTARAARPPARRRTPLVGLT